MALSHRLAALAATPGRSRRSIRLRLTLIYGGLFLICGAALLAITYVLVDNATAGYFSSTGPGGRAAGAIVGPAASAGKHGNPPAGCRPRSHAATGRLARWRRSTRLWRPTRARR